MQRARALDAQHAFRLHYPALYRFALRFSGDPDVAEDLVQEAFVRLLEQDLADDEVRPWLFVVTGNLARDRSRKRSRRRRLLEQHPPDPVRPEPPEISAERAERIAAVRAALQELSERDRTILLMGLWSSLGAHHDRRYLPQPASDPDRTAEGMVTAKA